MLLSISLISLLISIPGFVYKYTHSLTKSLIPFYNLYYFIRALRISPILLIILSLGIILLPIRDFFVTLIIVFMPFMVSDAYGKGIFRAVLTLILPFIMYPLTGYFQGIYSYDR